MSASAPLSIEANRVTGEVAIAIPPGTVADRQNKLVDEAITAALFDAASKLGAVVAAPAHRFARPLPGKDAEGRIRFEVKARSEGGRLVPDLNAPSKRRR